MPTDDLLNNRYMERRQETVPVGVAGDWTGTMGPYLVTVRLAADGTGLMCSSYNTNNTVINLKYAAGVLYFQDGTRMEIAKVGETLAGKTPYFGSATTKLYPDMGLSQAAPYCKKAM
jgi:hypothetical protein